MEIVRPIVQECFIPAQYTSSPEIIKNCLQEVLSEGMMYSQVSAPANNEDMTKKQRETIIKEETEKRKKMTLRTFYPEWFDYKWKDAMQFSGHRDVQTYIKHYCFSRYSDEQKRMELEKTLNVAPN